MSTEWFEGRSTDEQHEGCYWRRVGLVVLTAVVLAMIFWPLETQAEPLAQTVTGNGTVITLYTDKCELKEIVNLPHKATWKEKNKSYAGCWGISPLGVVMFYFEDKTTAVVPADMFEKVTGV